MGQFLQSPDPSIKLARQYGIRGLFSPDLVPSLQPVVLIDDLTGGIENNPKRTAMVFHSLTGVTAEFSQFRFETPPNIIAHLTKMYVLLESAGSFDFSFGASVAAPASFKSGVFTDGRLRSTGEIPAARLGFDTYATATVNIDFRYAGSPTQNLIVIEDLDIWMGRTDAFDFLEMFFAVADKNVKLALQWEEFTAEIAK